ncbi:type I restriction enzyme, S subunit [uncultured Gammaproteobacteria bacterium]
MTPDLLPYPAMKDSGVPWLGEVPEHWNVKRNKVFMHEVNIRSQDGLGDLLSVSQYTGVTRRRDRLSDEGRLLTNAASLVGYKKVQSGDLVINIMLAWNGSLGVSHIEGIVSPAYCVFRIRDADAIPGFIHYLFRTPVFTGLFKTVSIGVVDSRLRLYPDIFFRLSSSLPPFPEQSAIIRFLDHADRRIRRYVRAKRKLIRLLEEQKRAIIHQAVTRGLDPSVRLKPSGVEWLGDVPEHWELRRAKQVCTAIVDCKNRTPDAVENGGYTVVRTTNIRNGKFNLLGSYPTDRRNYEIWTQRGAPRSGDVFFTREAPAGEACLVPDQDNLCMGQRMMYFRPDTDVLDPRFLLLSIYGPTVKTYIQNACNGSTVGHLRLGQVTALPLLWCPLSEQKAIVDYVEEASKPINTTINRAEREIDLLNEYRTRLIADVVTGKLDVRAAAAGLPDETEESGLPDDTEIDAEDDADPTDELAEADG